MSEKAWQQKNIGQEKPPIWSMGVYVASNFQRQDNEKTCLS